MRDIDLRIANRDETYLVQARGRANFEYAVPLRELVKSLASFGRFCIDLSECTAMDSTFMGVLTMLALKSRRDRTEMSLCNANSTLQKLLRDLGVIKLFTFTEESPSPLPDAAAADAASPELLDTAETVSEAHKTLIGAAPENLDKFRDVVAFADADVERLKKKDRE